MSKSQDFPRALRMINVWKSSNEPDRAVKGRTCKKTQVAHASP